MSSLTTADVAALRRCDRTTAWRWMLRMQKTLGPKVVRREGPKRLVIDRAIFHRIMAEETAPSYAIIAIRLGALELSQEEQDRRIDLLARRVASVAGPGVRP